MRRLALALLEGAARELGSRVAAGVEEWFYDRRKRGGLDLNRCPDCGRPLCCAIHGADSRLVAGEAES